MPTPDDKMRAYIQEGVSRDMERYVASGRSLKGLSDQDLQARWVQALKDLAAAGTPERRRAVQDSTFELELRGLSVPFEEVEAALEQIRQNGLRDSAKLRANPDLYLAADRKLEADVEAANRDISIKTKH